VAERRRAYAVPCCIAGRDIGLPAVITPVLLPHLITGPPPPPPPHQNTTIVTETVVIRTTAAVRLLRSSALAIGK